MLKLCRYKAQAKPQRNEKCMVSIKPQHQKTESYSTWKQIPIAKKESSSNNAKTKPNRKERYFVQIKQKSQRKCKGDLSMQALRQLGCMTPCVLPQSSLSYLLLHWDEATTFPSISTSLKPVPLLVKWIKRKQGVWEPGKDTPPSSSILGLLGCALRPKTKQFCSLKL